MTLFIVKLSLWKRKILSSLKFTSQNLYSVPFIFDDMKIMVIFIKVKFGSLS